MCVGFVGLLVKTPARMADFHMFSLVLGRLETAMLNNQTVAALTEDSPEEERNDDFSLISEICRLLGIPYF